MLKLADSCADHAEIGISALSGNQLCEYELLILVYQVL